MNQVEVMVVVMVFSAMFMHVFPFDTVFFYDFILFARLLLFRLFFFFFVSLLSFSLSFLCCYSLYNTQNWMVEWTIVVNVLA